MTDADWATIIAIGIGLFIVYALLKTLGEGRD
jgi:hypothetical protein